MIERDLKEIIGKWLFKGKVITIYGARQVGKTTLAKWFLSQNNADNHYYDCESPLIRQLLERKDLEELKNFFAQAKIVVFDEAQKVADIGITLKLLHDHIPELQIIATGSSSFILSNKLQEPLTGRGIEFILYPFSYSEVSTKMNMIEQDALLKNMLVFGSYPEIFLSSTDTKRTLLNNLSAKYLFNDLYEIERIKRPDILEKLLQLLAFQVGSEVSRNELAVTLGVNRDTIDRYLFLLQSAFVIFKLPSFSRNHRKELSKKEKYYFYDNGIRNSLIANLNPLELRDDIGVLFENFCIVERMKYWQKKEKTVKPYFWRTYEQQEIDLIEEGDGNLHVFEFKWSEKSWKVPKPFIDTYKFSSSTLVTRKNFSKFVGE